MLNHCLKISAIRTGWVESKAIAGSSDKAQVRSIESLREDRAALNIKLLGAMVSIDSVDRSNWMDGLTGKCLQSMLEEKQSRKATFQHEMSNRKAATDYVDALTDVLQEMVLKFNISVGPELQLVVTRPSLVTEITKYNANREPLESCSYYRARVSSRSWSLVLRSQNNVIEFILMPASEVIGLSRGEANYEPMLTLTATANGGAPILKNDTLTVGAAQMESMCRILFKRLVQRSTEDFATLTKLDDDELQTLATVQPEIESVSEVESLEALPMESQLVTGEAIVNAQAIVAFFRDLVKARASAAEEVAFEEVESDGAEIVQTETREIECENSKSDAIEEVKKETIGVREFVVKENLTMIMDMHVRKITEALCYLIGDAEGAVEAAVRSGSQAFALRDFAAVEESRKQALSKSEVLNKLAKLQSTWSAVPGVCGDLSATSELAHGVYGPSLAADLVIDSVDQILETLTKKGTRAFEVRDFEDVKEQCYRAQRVYEFRLKASETLADYREAKREEALLVANG